MANEVKIAVKVQDYTKAGFGSITNGLGALKNNATAAIAPFGRLALGIVGVASSAGVAVKSVALLAKGFTLLAHNIGLLAPALAVIPALAAGVGLFVLSVKAASPGIVSAMKPVSDAFTELSEKVSDLAEKKLRPLADGFVKVNFPAIRKGIENVSGSVTNVIAKFGEWLNSAKGIETVKGITERTSQAAKDLEGPVSRLVIAFGNLVNRATDPAFDGLSGMLTRLTEKTTAWMDSISSDDINKALDSVKGFVDWLGKYVKVAMDVSKWAGDNKDKVVALTDAIAVAAIAIGLATGNIGAVIGGTATLTVNHWDTIKAEFGEGANFVTGVWQRLKDDPNIRGIWESVKTAFKGFVDSFRKETGEMGEKFRELVAKLKVAWEQWGPIIKAWWDGVGKPALSALGHIFGWLIMRLLDWYVIVADVFGKAGKVIRVFVPKVLDWFGQILSAAVKAFGWIPGIGPKLEKAEKDFKKFRDRVNAALDGIEDEHVGVYVTTYGSKGSGQGYSTGIFSGGITGSGRKGMASGGVTGAASGMVRGINLTRVNEQGQELARIPTGDIVSLPTGSTVIPHGQSQALLDRRRGEQIVVNLYAQGSILSERDIVRIIRDEFLNGGFRGVVKPA